MSGKVKEIWFHSTNQPNPNRFIIFLAYKPTVQCRSLPAESQTEWTGGCILPRWGRRAGRPSWWWRRWWAASEQPGSSAAAAPRRFVCSLECAPPRGPPPAPWRRPPSLKTSGRLADKQTHTTRQWRLNARGALENKRSLAEIKDMQDLVYTPWGLLLGSAGPKSGGQQTHTQLLSSSCQPRHCAAPQGLSTTFPVGMKRCCSSGSVSAHSRRCWS